MTRYFMASFSNRDLANPYVEFPASGGTLSLSVGTLADLQGAKYLWDDHADDLNTFSRPITQSMPWPSGFFRSVFRGVRDPAVGDDSGETLGTQIYNHGWLIAARLQWFLQDTFYGRHPIGYALSWPPMGVGVVVVDGTSAVDDGGNGWHGLTTCTVGGVGTIRHLVSGDGGSNRQVATILDRLAAVPTADRKTIGTTYAANLAAWAKLEALHPHEWEAPTEPEKQYLGRVGLNMQLARAALGGTGVTSDVARGVCAAMDAITAKECGLVGSVLTEADYQALTEPIDAVIAMPAGY